MKFSGADSLWLDFVSAHRHGTYEGKQYDVIIGPVADDNVYLTFTLYESGVLTKAQVLKALRIRKLFNQYTFTTEKALSLLHFSGTLGAEQ